MLASVPKDQLRGKRVLEIGGGVGALQAELLLRGAGSGEVVELVSAYAPYAAELAREAGVADRTRFRVADVLGDPTSVEPADVVLLDKVICCSPEGLDLVTISAGLTRGVLVLSYPRYTWVLRAAAWLEHRLIRLLRREYRFFVRPPEGIEAAAVRAGLTRLNSGRGLVWEYTTFGRAPSS